MVAIVWGFIAWILAARTARSMCSGGSAMESGVSWAV